MEFTNANQIHAAYMDMLNKGQHYVATLSQGPLHITDWREQQLRALVERQENHPKPDWEGIGMEWGEVEIRKTEQSGVEAEIRGDMLNSGGDGCWVSIVGWGPTEDVARANLATAVHAERKTPEA